MIIDKIHITKFHGFKDVGFKLGSNLTIIAGQNGTQKTTLLGIMSQTFTLSKDSPMKDEKPLCGGNYKSAFSDKFKLSPQFDKPGEHEWTISFLSKDEEDYTVASMYRDKSKDESIRFWKKGSRGKGTGYAQYPVIFLSLKRLIPLGEEPSLKAKLDIKLDDKEIELFKSLHNDILFSFEEITEANIIESPNKTTLGMTTNRYDWMQNSAGQDNVGKILLALLSFKRLKEKYKKTYKGGLLFIDELDATMYPGSQRKLLEVLRSFSSKYKIQVVFTTHSLTLLENGYQLLKEADSNPSTVNSVQILYLEKKDDSIEVQEKFPFAAVRNRLQHITSPKTKQKKVILFTEDPEAVALIRSLLNGIGCVSRIEFSTCKFGKGNLINLIQSKLEYFQFPNSIIVFDGDVSADKDDVKKLSEIKHTHNWVFLPSTLSPERLLSDYLASLSDKDPLWTMINPDYTKHVCFDAYKPDKIASNRDVAKLWFQGQSQQYPNWCTTIIKSWKKSSPERENMAKSFVKSFVDLFNMIAEEVRIPKIIKKL